VGEGEKKKRLRFGQASAVFCPALRTSLTLPKSDQKINIVIRADIRDSFFYFFFLVVPSIAQRAAQLAVRVVFHPILNRLEFLFASSLGPFEASPHTQSCISLQNESAWADALLGSTQQLVAQL